MNTSLDVLIQAASYVDRPAPLKNTQPPQPAHSSERDSDFSCGSTVGSPHSATLTEDNLASGGPNAEVAPKGDALQKDKKTRRRSAAALSRQASSSAASACSDSWRTAGGNKRGYVTSTIVQPVKINLQCHILISAFYYTDETVRSCERK